MVVALAKLPAAQGAQAVLEAGDTEPEAQLVQMVEPAVLLKVPAAQAAQVLLNRRCPGWHE